MKQWKFRSRNSKSTRYRDFSKDFHKTSSRTARININSFKLSTDDLQSPLSHRIPFHQQEITRSMQDRTLISWGSGKEGALGTGKTQDSPLAAPLPYLLNKTITQIVCGAGNTLVLTSDNQIFSWGFNSVGQLGLGNFNNCSAPSLLTHNFGQVQKIIAGAGHCLLINTEGNLFSWGCAGYYQTGHGSLDHSPQPSRIKFFNNHIVTDAACGISHTLVVSDSKVYAFGDNSHCQCSGKELYYKDPIVVNLMDIVAVAAGGAHSVFLNRAGEVFSCGLNSCGQVSGKSRGCVEEPVVVRVGRVKSVYAGEEISAALSFEGKVYVWGWNGFGQLAQGHFADIQFPVCIDIGEEVEKVSIGVSAIALISKSEKLYISGYIGQCLKSEQKNDAVSIDKNLAFSVRMFKDALITQVGVGRTHCVAFIYKILRMDHSDSFEVLECNMKAAFVRNEPSDGIDEETELEFPEIIKRLTIHSKKPSEIWMNTEKETLEAESHGLQTALYRESSMEATKRPRFSKENPLTTLLSFQKAKEEGRELGRQFKLYERPLQTAKLHSEDKLYIEAEPKVKKIKSLEKEYSQERHLTNHDFLPAIFNNSNMQKQRIKELESLISRYDNKISKYQEKAISPKFTGSRALKRTGGGYLG